MSVAELPHKLPRKSVIPLEVPAVQLVPSKCRIVPKLPTAQTSDADAPHTP
jgi:ABC-type antimicrobial peptide transport system ATPase subunit